MGRPIASTFKARLLGTTFVLNHKNGRTIMIRNRLLLAIVALLWTLPAYAQIQPGQGVTQSGAVTAGHCVAWQGSNVVVDSGAACGGSGTVPAPTPTTLGGVFQAAAGANQFQTGISSTGAPTFAQPAFSNLTGTASAGQLAAGAAVSNIGYTPAHAGANTDITSLGGITTPISAAQGGTGGNGVATGYSPTYAAVGGTGVTFTPNASAALIIGKTSLIQASVTVNFTTAPSSITISLPSGTANLANTLAGANYSTNASLTAISNNSTTVSLTSSIGASPVTVTGQVIGFGGFVFLQ